MLEPTWSHSVQPSCVHQAWMWGDSQTGASRRSLLSFIHLFYGGFSGYADVCVAKQVYGCVLQYIQFAFTQLQGQVAYVVITLLQGNFSFIETHAVLY